LQGRKIKPSRHRDFAAGVLSVRCPLLSYYPILPSLTRCICVPGIKYTFFTQGKKRGGEIIREKIRRAIVHKKRSNIPT